MRASKGGDLPKDLLRGRSRFQAWRRRRKTRGRIPDTLWALAVRLVKIHGVNRTALALGVDYYSLKKRVEAASSKPPATGPAFVELPGPAETAEKVPCVDVSPYFLVDQSTEVLIYRSDGRLFQQSLRRLARHGPRVLLFQYSIYPGVPRCKPRQVPP